MYRCLCSRCICCGVADLSKWNQCKEVLKSKLVLNERHLKNFVLLLFAVEVYIYIVEGVVVICYCFYWNYLNARSGFGVWCRQNSI